jgi:hypothetical protein
MHKHPEDNQEATRKPRTSGFNGLKVRGVLASGRVGDGGSILRYHLEARDDLSFPIDCFKKGTQWTDPEIVCPVEASIDDHLFMRLAMASNAENFVTIPFVMFVDA